MITMASRKFLAMRLNLSTAFIQHHLGLMRQLSGISQAFVQAVITGSCQTVIMLSRSHIFVILSFMIALPMDVSIELSMRSPMELKAFSVLFCMHAYVVRTTYVLTCRRTCLSASACVCA